MSFKASQDDKTKKIVSDPLTSAGFMSILSQEAFDSSQKRCAGEPQVRILPFFSFHLCIFSKLKS